MIKDWKTMREMALEMAKNGFIPVFGEFCAELEEIVTECIFLAMKLGLGKVTLLINSNGGQIDSIAAIRGAMNLSGIEFMGVAMGKARSNGLMLLQLCHVRTAIQSTSFMFHWGHYRLDNSDIAALWNGETWPIEHILAYRRAALEEMHTRTGIPTEKLVQFAMFEREFSVTEALELHLIDSIVADLPVTMPEVAIESNS